MTVRRLICCALFLTGGYLGAPAHTHAQSRPARPADMAPGEGFWADYKFIPGDRVLFYEDYTVAPLEALPSRLEVLKGTPQLIERRGQRFLKVNRHAGFRIPLPDTLPPNFTIEFDLALPGGVVAVFCPIGDGANFRQNPHFQFRINESGVKFGRGPGAVTDLSRVEFRDLWRCHIAGDGARLTVYVNDTRIADLVDPGFLRGASLQFDVQNSSREDIIFGPIRIAEGRRQSLAEGISKDGRATTHGILFDAGGDRLRPESTPILKEIAAILQDNAGMRLLIAAHTDSNGDYKSNQDLSDRRAAAVREFLVSQYGVDAARLEVKGFGESKPIASGSSPEAGQENLRIEIIKL